MVLLEHMALQRVDEKVHFGRRTGLEYSVGLVDR